MVKNYKTINIILISVTVISALIPIIIMIAYKSVPGKVTEVTKYHTRKDQVVTIEYYFNDEKYTLKEHYNINQRISEGDEMSIFVNPSFPYFTFRAYDSWFYYIVSAICVIALIAEKRITSKKESTNEIQKE